MLKQSLWEAVTWEESAMRALKGAAVAAAFALLLVGTVLVFEAFDRQSHSTSDTLRPFLITMAPVWAVAVAGAWAWLRTPAQKSTAE